MTIAQTILGEFDHGWNMLSAVIEITPDEHWATGEDDYLIPARLLWHTIEAIDCNRYPNSDDFPWGEHFGTGWGKATPDQLPTKKQLATYISETKQAVIDYLKPKTDEQMMTPEPTCKWFSSILHKTTYILRHTHQHIGEINAELRRRGLERTKW